MPTGSPAADSSTPVTQSMIDDATDLFGTTPVFWGRYFTSVSTTGGAEYRHAQENALLGNAGIRVLPIARQTAHVGGTQQQGLADGQANAKDFITTFGLSLLVAQGSVFYMFLDSEGNPSLSLDYYTGWVQGLAQEADTLSAGTVQILPCVYGGHSDISTWKIVQQAMANGIACQGAWIARYPSTNCALPAWQPGVLTPPAPAPFTIPILAWQYAQDCLQGAIDSSVTNPSLDVQAELLNFLVLPPS